MIGVQAEGSSPVVSAFKAKKMEATKILKPDTIATAIRIGAPASSKKALRAIYDSKGYAERVSDKEILEGQMNLAKLEGIFVEPASASPIAALKKLIRKGIISSDDEIVCIATGNGLKDPDVVTNFLKKPLEVKADLTSIKNVIDDEME